MYTINYNTRELTLSYNGCAYLFNLDDGDTGDYWNSFEHNGETLDVNFSQEDEHQVPSLSVYHLDKDGYIDMNTLEEIEFGGFIGDSKNYF